MPKVPLNSVNRDGCLAENGARDLLASDAFHSQHRKTLLSKNSAIAVCVWICLQNLRVKV